MTTFPSCETSLKCFLWAERLEEDRCQPVQAYCGHICPFKDGEQIVRIRERFRDARRDPDLVSQASEIFASKSAATVLLPTSNTSMDSSLPGLARSLDTDGPRHDRQYGACKAVTCHFLVQTMNQSPVMYLGLPRIRVTVQINMGLLTRTVDLSLRSAGIMFWILSTRKLGSAEIYCTSQIRPYSRTDYLTVQQHT